MLIRPHDAPIDTEHERRDLVIAHPFGHLIAPGKDREVPRRRPDTHPLRRRRHDPPVPRPTEPGLAGAAQNPRCLFVVTAAVAYIPTSWEAPPGTPAEWGFPTSHYTVVVRTRPQTERVTDSAICVAGMLVGAPSAPDAHREPIRQVALANLHLRRSVAW